jgi:hypothetical protein
MDLGSFHLRISFGLEDRSEPAPVRLEDLPRLEVSKT